MSSATHRRPAAVDPMNRKIVQNPKYADVKATLDTGRTAPKTKFLTPREIALRRGEPFARLQPMQLRQILEQAAALDESNNGDHEEAGSAAVFGAGGVRTVVVDEGKRIGASTQGAQFLLLDTRSSDEFVKCHIAEAISCPAVQVSRMPASTPFFS